MSAALERRYRLLLRAYPADHRHEYGEEMLGVLLAGADPDRRFPTVRDAADLLASAIGSRTRRTLRDLRDPAWRDAALAVQIFGVLFLLVMDVRRIALEYGTWVLHDQAYTTWQIYPSDWARTGAWALALALILLRARRSAAVATVLAAALDIGVPIRSYLDRPGSLMSWFWLCVAAAIVAAAAVVVAFGDPPARPRAVIPAAVAGLLLAGTGAASYPVLVHLYTFPVGDRLVAYALLPVYAAILVLGLVAFVRQPARVRRRMVVLAVPVLATVLADASQYSGVDGDVVTVLGGLAGTQWMIMLALPVLGFLGGLAGLHAWERFLGLVALGRAAERAGPPAA
jgi:hypothetical protein